MTQPSKSASRAIHMRPVASLGSSSHLRIAVENQRAPPASRLAKATSFESLTAVRLLITKAGALVRDRTRGKVRNRTYFITFEPITSIRRGRTDLVSQYATRRTSSTVTASDLSPAALRSIARE